MRPSNPFPVEHPPYSFAEYPKVVGYEEDGKTPIVANDAEEEARLAPPPVEEAPEPKGKVRLVKGSKVE